MSFYIDLEDIMFFSSVFAFFLIALIFVEGYHRSRAYKAFKGSTKSIKRSKSELEAYLNNPKKKFPITVPFEGPNLKSGICSVINEIIPHAQNLTVNDIDITPLTGGITNIPYVVSLKPLHSKVIVRIFGEGTSEIIDRNVENLVFSNLSQLAIGPTFYGLFENGRIEGYFHSRNLEPHEMTLPLYIPSIAKSIANFHSQSITTINQDITVWKTLYNFLSLAQTAISTMNHQRDSFRNNPYISKLNIHTMMEQYYVLKQYFELISFNHSTTTTTTTTTTTDTGVSTSTNILSEDEIKHVYFIYGQQFGHTKVLAHNDLLSGNILLLYNNDNNNNNTSSLTTCTTSPCSSSSSSLSVINASHNSNVVTDIMCDEDDNNNNNDNSDREMVLIDFEYAGYNMRAWDLANHFCECAGFDANFEQDFPTYTQRLSFYIAYILSLPSSSHSSQKTTITTTTTTPSTPLSTTTTTTTTTMNNNNNNNNNMINNDKLSTDDLEKFKGSSSLSSHMINHTENNDLNKDISTSSADHTSIQTIASTTDTSTTAIVDRITLILDEMKLLLCKQAADTHTIQKSSDTSDMTDIERVKIDSFMRGFDDAVCKYTLVSHLFWGSWAIVQAANSHIEFDFLPYSYRRQIGYQLHKKQFFNNQITL